jgi:hypothetical protein
MIAVGNDYVLHEGAHPVLYASLDSGTTWQRLSAASYIFAFDPHDANTVLVAGWGEIWRVRLDRQSARRAGVIPGAVAIVALLVDREDFLTIYAATADLGDGGARVSHDGGATWSPLGTAFPAVNYYQQVTLAQDTANARRLYLAPYASGLWTLELPLR